MMVETMRAPSQKTTIFSIMEIALSCNVGIPGKTERRKTLRYSSRPCGNLALYMLVLVVFSLSPSHLSRSAYFVEAGNDDYYNGAGDDYGNVDDASVDGDNAKDDDDYLQYGDINFDSVSVMPVSCVNYNNGHMIKFELFDNGDGYQCHFMNIGTFVVSIAHYMRAYFNHQAMLYGSDFQLPGDAGYLNCVMLQGTASAEMSLYAKIGCVDRDTFTSTKLQLHVYTDAQCSIPFDDGENSRHHSNKGYKINGYYFPTRVSFRPPFYSCQTCSSDFISDSFNKKNGNWYDDAYISQNGNKQNDDNENSENENDYVDDDQYMDANDDVNNDDENENNYNTDEYNVNDDFYNRRSLIDQEDRTLAGELETYQVDFWNEVNHIRRALSENYYDVDDWNMCQRIYRYGVWCDDECRALDTFRVDEWSTPDIVLVVVMCTFIAAMMLLVLAKRLKVEQKARVYGDYNSQKPGLPPLAMLFLFVVIIGGVVTLAKLKFVNQTLVFTVVVCILLFIYMLKLTFFESRRPVLLATPRHDLDDRLFD